MIPARAVLDPELTVSLPAHLTAATDMDALTHNIESLTAPVFHPMCDGIAVKGIEFAAKYLEKAVKDPSGIEVRGLFEEKYGKKGVSVMQCGAACETLVKYASVSSDLHDANGRTGMGAVFGSKSLRAVVVKSTGTIEFEDPEGLGALGKTAVSRIPDPGFVSTIKKYGTEGIVMGNAEAGNLCVHNYSTGYHDDYAKLDRSNYDEDFLAKGTTCFGCAVSCRKTVKSEGTYQVTHKLGGPEFETIGVLGSNMDIFDPVAVAKANELSNTYGIDTITFDGIASYLAESVEKGLGADHMSSEHDWLIMDNSEASRGLGIMETDDVNSTGINKVRMAVYSQYYYSVLDSLNLCMFC